MIAAPYQIHIQTQLWLGSFILSRPIRLA